MQFKANEPDSLKVGDSLLIELPTHDLRMRCTITDLETSLRGTVTMVLSSQSYLPELLRQRIIPVDIINHEFYGLKVPIQSIYGVDDEQKIAYVKIVKGGIVESRKVSIVGRDSYYAALAPYKPLDGASPEDIEQSKQAVMVYDAYVVNPGAVNEGEQLK
jgi:HlyD family secretion protein